MSKRVSRHLPVRPAPAAGMGAPGSTLRFADLLPPKPPELTWPDYLLMLLHVGAEIEHALMVEYLYAAYSLGGNDVPEGKRAMVARWQSGILAVAKEEMGHLLTVQNLLCLLGGPINLYREDHPWDSPFYPFRFELKRLTRESLACYVYAERPMRSPTEPEWEVEVYAETEKLVRDRNEHPHPVSEIYELILHLLEDEEKIPDSAFRPDSYAMQASWDEWGKGYRPYRLDEGAPEASKATRYEAHVIVEQMASRTQAVAAIRAVAGQGEAPDLQKGATQEVSHFERFADVYREFVEHDGERFTRAVPDNPSTTHPLNFAEEGTYIANPVSREWANLFNLRYRMLLTYLGHTFRLARTVDPNQPSERTGTLHRVFGEMYNLKTIAGVLVRMPLLEDESDPRRAGPPFQMPYTLSLPADQGDCWRLHRELLTTSREIAAGLLARTPPPDGDRYLRTLLELDRQSQEWIDQMLIGLRPITRSRP
jgi:hypothetical protein